MDPISALGVAAAALQFLDFGLSTLELCREVRDNVEGARKANAEFEQRARTIKSLQKDLKTTTSSKTQGSRRITKIGTDCTAAADELIRVLEAVRGASATKSFSTAKATFRAMRERRTIEKLYNTLKEKQGLLNSALISDIRNRVDLAAIEQSKGFTSLKDSVQSLVLDLKKYQAVSSRQHAETTVQLTSIESTTKSIARTIQAGNGELRQDVSTLQDTMLEQFSGMKLADAPEDLLISLFYPEHAARRETVRPPWENTFAWIFQDKTPYYLKWSNFSEWLENSNSVYWINGKAGSGKSTLMAHILHENKTREGLTLWARNKPFHMLSFFFWRAGSQLQKSISGLLRSLLYQICEEVPHLANALITEFPLPVGRIPQWTETRLSVVIQGALKIANNTKFCFFIDGLDEFEGDTDELLDLVFNLQAFDNVKCCVSSRPEIRLVERLSTCAQLRLQEFNYNDISDFVSGKLAAYQDPNDTTDTKYFVNNICCRAEGVFLWAALVTQSVIRGLQAGDDDETIRERLKATPAEIDGLFEQMFTNIDEVHKSSLAFFFQAVKFGDSIGFDFISVALVTASLFPESVFSYQDFLKRCQQIKKRIVAQSRGLLEVHVLSFSPQAKAWALPASITSDSIMYENTPKKALKTAVCMRRLADCSSLDREFLIAEKTYISFIHRSAYDFISSTGAKSTLGAFDTPSQVLVQSAILQGQIKLLIAAPAEIEPPDSPKSPQNPSRTRPRVSQNSLRMKYPRVSQTLSRMTYILQLISEAHPELIGVKYEVLDEVRELMPCFTQEELAESELRYWTGSGDEVLNAKSSAFLEAVKDIHFWEGCILFGHFGYIQDRLFEIAGHPARSIIYSSLIRNCCLVMAKGDDDIYIYYLDESPATQYAALLSSLLKSLWQEFFLMSSDISKPCLRFTLDAIRSSFGFDISWWDSEDESLQCDKEIVIKTAEAWHLWAKFVDEFKTGLCQWEDEDWPLIVDELTNLFKEIMGFWGVHISIHVDVYDSPGPISFMISVADLPTDFYEKVCWRRGMDERQLDTYAIEDGQSKLRIICTNVIKSLGDLAGCQSSVMASHDLSMEVTIRLLNFLWQSEQDERGYGLGSFKVFRGTLEEYQECQQLVIDDVSENSDGKLNGWEQLYILACLRTRFRQLWYIVDESDDSE